MPSSLRPHVKTSGKRYLVTRGSTDNGDTIVAAAKLINSDPGISRRELGVAKVETEAPHFVGDSAMISVDGKYTPRRACERRHTGP